jgi:hypothetical protein
MGAYSFPQFQPRYLTKDELSQYGLPDADAQPNMMSLSGWGVDFD